MSHIGVNLGFGNLHEKLTDEQMYAGELGLAELADRLGYDSRVLRRRPRPAPDAAGAGRAGGAGDRAARRGMGSGGRGAGPGHLAGDDLPEAQAVRHPVRAIRHGDLYALTHPEWYSMVERRHQAIAAAFRQAGTGPP